MAKMLKVLFALGMAGVASQGVAAGGPYAVFKTAEGEFVCELYPAKAPKTVEKLVGLATGKKAWNHPGSQKKMEGTP
ncbi:MAG: peptidylprolyl isomerase, partial [Candidatus Sumerlaeaceae bacterium]|nr:peptidylprolyl isomerase [Candidatus Sumerlaeaceae bacterium]